MTDTATVTVLFTDVVDSSQLRISRGESTVHQVLRTHFDLVRPYIERYSDQEVEAMNDSFRGLPSDRLGVPWNVQLLRGGDR